MVCFAGGLLKNGSRYLTDWGGARRRRLIRDFGCCAHIGLF
jgi:hypothetical protein